MKTPQFVRLKKKKAECYIASMEIYTSKRFNEQFVIQGGKQKVSTTVSQKYSSSKFNQHSSSTF